MLRLLGFIAGATLTALVLLDLDPHEALHRGEALVAEARQWAQVAAELPAAESSGTEPLNESPAADNAPKAAGGAGPATTETAEQGGGATDLAAPDKAVEGPEGPPHAVSPPLVTQPPTGGWQPLWRPFRSERSARGFAGQIAEITGRETRVRRLGPRSHQVDVAFTDEAERREALQRLELLTGIELREEGS